MPKITELFAFIVVDKDENDEGVMAFRTPGGSWTPMVGADMKRVESLKSIADDLSKSLGKSYRILRFKLDGEI